MIDAYSSPTIASDAATWSHDHGLPRPNLTLDDNAAERDQPEGLAIPTDVPVVGGLNLQDPEGWFGEETLDVEAVHAMAPGAAIVVQSALSPENIDLHMAQNKVVSNDEAQIVSNSYGGTDDSTDKTSDGYWEQAAAEGIGVYFSSGDDGDQTAGGTDPASRTVDAGPNSPYVTAVGGTTLAVGRSRQLRVRDLLGHGHRDADQRRLGDLDLPVRRRRGHQPGLRRAVVSVIGRPRSLQRLLAGQRQREQPDDPGPRRARRGDARRSQLGL